MPVARVFPPNIRFLDDLAKAIGLGDQAVRSIELRASVDEIVTVKAEMVLLEDHARELMTVLRRYNVGLRLVASEVVGGGEDASLDGPLPGESPAVALPPRSTLPEPDDDIPPRSYLGRFAPWWSK